MVWTTSVTIYVTCEKCKRSGEFTGCNLAVAKLNMERAGWVTMTIHPEADHGHAVCGTCFSEGG